MGDGDQVTAAPPRSSVEKLDEALEQLAGAKGEDAAHKMLLASFKAALPSLRKLGYIPTDAAELDDVLLIGAQWMLAMRSDDAEQPAPAVLGLDGFRIVGTS